MFKFLSSYDPRRREPYRGTKCLLSVCEDGFVGHPVGDHALVLADIWDKADVETKVKPVVKAQRLALINFGWHDDGLVLNFRADDDAVLFRLYYHGEATVP